MRRTASRSRPSPRTSPASARSPRRRAACGREVVVVGRAMDRVIDVATRMRLSRRPAGVPPPDTFGYLPRDKVVALLTGSQGEPRAALARIATGRASRHRAVAGRPGDLLVARHPRQREGGRHDHQQPHRAGHRGHHRPHAISSTSPAIRAGTSCAQMYAWTRPRIAIPAHGEAAASRRACELRPRAGRAGGGARRATARMVRLAPGPAEIIDEVPAGRLYRDGDIVIDSRRPGDRRAAQARLRGHRQRRHRDRRARRASPAIRSSTPMGLPEQNAQRRDPHRAHRRRGGRYPRRPARRRSGAIRRRSRTPSSRAIRGTVNERLGQEAGLPRARDRGLTGRGAGA